MADPTSMEMVMSPAERNQLLSCINASLDNEENRQTLMRLLEEIESRFDSVTREGHQEENPVTDAHILSTIAHLSSLLAETGSFQYTDADENIVRSKVDELRVQLGSYQRPPREWVLEDMPQDHTVPMTKIMPWDENQKQIMVDTFKADLPKEEKTQTIIEELGRIDVANIASASHQERQLGDFDDDEVEGVRGMSESEFFDAKIERFREERARIAEILNNNPVGTIDPLRRTYLGMRTRELINLEAKERLAQSISNQKEKDEIHS